MNEYHLCPVCGYPYLKYLPRSVRDGGSYEICRSCGFQFGVSDDDLGYTYESWRRRWVDRGMPWASASFRPAPDDWEPAEWLASVTS